ncbi:hypothetical protein C2W62_38950 [Candidatus Entotheonella serta]|nr:hypothetical protein C2W62_38950 [Candidatus Entotheonella serta]
MRTLLTDLPSPLPLRRLGVVGEKVLWESSFGDLALRDRACSFARGLGGMLVDRWSPLGG